VTARDLVSLPKAELHLHLEGAIRAETAVELAERNGLPVPASGRFRDLSEFVASYERARDLIADLDDLRRIAGELVEDAQAQRVVWSEVHLIPPTYAGRLGPAEGVLEAVLDGFRSASTESSSAGVIIGINRGLGHGAAEESLRLAVRYREDGVLGLGLAGDEAHYPANDFEEIFADARAAGLRALPHGGEGAGADSVRACVDVLGAHRVLHGIRAVEDPDLLELLAERQICLDVCPSSNVALQVTPSLAEHPLPQLLDARIPVTLSSDCPLFVGTSSVEEYRRARHDLGLPDAALAEMAENSLKFSSCPGERRHRAMRAIAEWRE
jgi:adenosine deaminase